MLKLPKGLKKKKKGKKSKRKGEDELFTEEELEKYRKEHQQQQAESGESSVKENEEWSKFKDLTTGVDSVLKKTQGDLDRIKSTSFFQRKPTGAQQPAPPPRPAPAHPVVQLTEADFRRPAPEPEPDDDRSDCGLTDDDSDEDEGDDLFDTSYVEAVERGEVKLTYVPDSPEDCADDIFDTSHVDALIRGNSARTGRLDIGVAVEVLTGRIDNVTLPTTTRRSKRIRDPPPPEVVRIESPPAELVLNLLESGDSPPPLEPIDLSVSLHPLPPPPPIVAERRSSSPEEFDEFSLLAAESLEAGAEAVKFEVDVKLEPVLQESWSVFEADKNDSVFAEGVVEDQIDVIDPYIDGDDPFDTTFAETVVPSTAETKLSTLEDDDDFDPRADEIQSRLNNRRKSSVRIHLTDPAGIRESITSDDIVVTRRQEAPIDLLAGSTTDLTQLDDSLLDPVDPNDDCEIDPFDTSAIPGIVAPGKAELKHLEEELIGATDQSTPLTIFRVPSDPEFNPRAETPSTAERRASRPENLGISARSVAFTAPSPAAPTAPRAAPATPYYAHAPPLAPAAPSTPPVADPFDTSFADAAPTRTELRLIAREFSCEEPPAGEPDLLEPTDDIFQIKALTPEPPAPSAEFDPFDTSFAGDLNPGRTELRLLESELLN